MRLFALATVIALVFGSLGTAAAVPSDTAAAAGNTTATPASSSETNTTTVQIDSNTELLEAGYNGQRGMAWVRIRSDTRQVVTVSDAGALADGSGVIETRTLALEPGEEVRMEVAATKIDGAVAVTIDTENTLYGRVIQPQNESPFEKTGPTEGWLGGATAVGAMTILAAYRELNKGTKAPEKAT